jgi:hypothetical protein
MQRGKGGYFEPGWEGILHEVTKRRGSPLQRTEAEEEEFTAKNAKERRDTEMREGMGKFLDLKALVFAVVSRAFSAMAVSDYEPRALPGAGMKDTFGVDTTSPRQEWEK